MAEPLAEYGTNTDYEHEPEEPELGQARGGRRRGFASILGAVLLSLAVAPVAHGRGTFTLRVVDGESGQEVPFRIVLTRSNGTPAPVRRGIDAGVGDVVDGAIEFALAPNIYQFEISRGPEYRVTSGTFVMDRDSEDSRTLELSRIADLATEGWVAGDLMTAVRPRDLGTLMASETLSVAALLSDGEPGEMPDGYAVRTDLVRGEGEAEGLLAIGIDPRAVRVAPTRGPSSDFLRDVSRRANEVDPPQVPRWVITNPLAWDVPIWLASGRVDGVIVLGDFLQLDRERTTLAGSRLSTKFDFQGPRGLGRWAEHVYCQMLEAGLQPVPAAASGAGLVPNPLGYNRVYVHRPASTSGPSDFSGEAWWDGLWQGRSVVTNGPLLRPTLDGFVPGHRFAARAGETLELTLELKLAIREPADYLEVVRDGRVVYHAGLDEFAKAGGIIPPLRFEQSGWVLVRVMTKYESHYRAAISAPWFVIFDGQPRISARGVAFFQEWLGEREQILLELPAEELKRHVPYGRAARLFWQQRAEAANAP